MEVHVAVAVRQECFVVAQCSCLPAYLPAGTDTMGWQWSAIVKVLMCSYLWGEITS